MVGEPIHRPMAHLAEQSGAYSASFCAQTVTAELVDNADLVLGMDAAAPGGRGRPGTCRHVAHLHAA